MTIDEDALQFLIHHKGTHNHEAPPAVGKMSFMSQKEFEKFVLLSPETKPRQLKLGSGFHKTAYEISPNLINTDKIKYERNKILKHYDISNTLEMVIKLRSQMETKFIRKEDLLVSDYPHFIMQDDE